MTAAIRTRLAAGLFLGMLTSCTPVAGKPRETLSSRNDGFATTFRRGDFVPDRRTPVPADSHDLREQALSLPVWESDSDSAALLKWVYEKRFDPGNADTWTTPADGAQSAIRLTRLPDSPGGAQRISLTIPPGKLFNEDWGKTRHSVLERRSGGWLVLSAKTVRH